MTFLHTVRTGFRHIWNIGVIPEIRPEEAKHVRYTNIGAFILFVASITAFIQGLVEGKVAIIVPFANLLASTLSLGVYLLNRSGWYHAARIYLFLVFYALALFAYPFTGKEFVDQYFLFTPLGFSFLVFPRKERGSIALIIVLGIICYLAVMALCQHVEPVLHLDESALALHNQIIIYAVMLIFILGMMAAKYLINRTEDSLSEERKKLAEMSEVLKKMFGRYLSTEVMNSLIENPSALELGGERRSVTIMMTDLRGFTALSERLEPEQVVQMLNTYFKIIMDVVFKYSGTINEIIGDALLIIFGAPQSMPDRAQKAIACAIEMQNAMVKVNEQNRIQGLPELQMGIGLNEAEVVVGNVGSDKRSKYAVVGSGVNMTSRIESYTVGGQILISESMFKEAGKILRIDGQHEVFPKGADTPIRVYEVGGIAGSYNMALTRKDGALVTLLLKIPVTYTILGGKHVGKEKYRGFIVALSKKSLEMVLEALVEPLTNLRINLADIEMELSIKDVYGKVIERSRDQGLYHRVRLTAVPPEIAAYFHALRRHAARPIAQPQPQT